MMTLSSVPFIWLQHETSLLCCNCVDGRWYFPRGLSSDLMWGSLGDRVLSFWCIFVSSRDGALGLSQEDGRAATEKREMGQMIPSCLRKHAQCK